jgi:hypothetical protein
MISVALRLASGFVCVGLLAPAVHAGEVRAGDLVITQAWSRATPGGAQVAGGYLTIENKGPLPDRLVSGTTDAARKIEIHEMAADTGIMTMRSQWIVRMDAPQSGRWSLALGIKLSASDQVNIAAPILIR